jgi:hypothetical protein
MFYLRGSGWSTCFGVAPAPRNMGLTWPNTTAPVPPAARERRYPLHGSTNTFVFVLWGL